MKTIVVTRHPAFAQYAVETGICGDDTEVIDHATDEHVRGNRVIGNLPLHLAALASSVVVVPLIMPPELRGAELSLDQMRKYAGEVREYAVQEVPSWWRHGSDRQ